MKLIPAHRAWLAFIFMTRKFNFNKIKIDDVLQSIQLETLKKYLPGICLDWRDSWSDGFIKTSNHSHVLPWLESADVLLEAFFSLNLTWKITYIFYGAGENLEFDYTEENTTIKNMQDTVNHCIREPAIDWIKENEPDFVTTEEGWKAIIL